MSLKVALIGCGNIGNQIVDAILSGQAGDVELHSIVGTPRSAKKVELMAKRANCNWLTDPMNIELNEIDLIIEAAGQKVIKEYIIPFLEKGKNVMIISIGALGDSQFLERVRKTAQVSGSKVYLPSGAIGGLDALRSASLSGLESVELITRKPPSALKDAPYIMEQGIDLDHLTTNYEVFIGNALEAAEAFPANLNVAVAVSLAGIGPKRTRVRIIACPEIQSNIHEIKVVGNCGRFHLQFENLPSPNNPKTSHLATLSVISTLQELGASIQGVAYYK